MRSIIATPRETGGESRLCEDARVASALATLPGILAVLDQFEQWVSSDWAYAAIFAVATIDAFFPLVPSETVVITAGVLAGAGDLNLLLVILCASTGAILGDNISYGLGTWLGEHTVKRVFKGEKSHKGFEWAERQLAQVLQVLADGLPALASIEQRAHDLVGDGLDAAEHVGQVLGCAERQAQTAAPHHHGRDPMPQRLGERRRQLHLGVVVRVKVDEPRHHPLAGRIHDPLTLQSVADRDHLPTLDPHIGDPSGRPPPVEDRAATNDNVHHRRRLARNPHAR